METSLENWRNKNRERIETILKTCKTSRQLLEKDWSANSTLMNSEHFEIMLGNHWEQHWELQRRLWTIETTHFWIRYIESGKVERLRLHKWGKIRTWTSLLTKKRSKQWEHRPYRPSRHLTTFHSHTQRRTRVLPCPVPKYRFEKRCNMRIRH